MEKDDDLTIETRARSNLYIVGGGEMAVVEDQFEVRRRLDEASGPSDWINFTALSQVGEVARPQFDPCEITIERGHVYGFGVITRRKWEDRLRDMKASAMVPRMGFPLAVPGGGPE